MQQQEAGKQPFFAQFLEGQKRTQETSGENYIDLESIITKPWLDMEHTLKYPSDGDEV
ncbi:serine endopeptidase [Paraflavitalea soli]|uniref:Serine endopeptidase n=1 Tax=Paraflavitalea soli TaxID=2315862 RepID=A0A3B7MJI0_9BACT|nr:microviridin/marinostatin family tricyclic proteinase inhibitor [Paraflavitalea soli]AXY74338.1 serine endopeptidase [Paraflavitalea soli]